MWLIDYNYTTIYQMKSKWFAVIVIILSLYFCLFSVQKIDLVTADIGRHIKNGEVFLHSAKFGISKEVILHTNLFSYTNPGFPFVNHHWGSGVIAYLIYSVSGFNGLSLAYIALLLAGLIFALATVREDVHPADLFLAGLFLVPLLAERSEVRPEVVSFLFISVFIFLLYRFFRGRLGNKILWLIPILELLWVNMHIYFIFGIFIIGIFFLESLFTKQFEKTKKLFWVGLASGVATLITPYGITGALYPFTIFRNYGYMIVENQSISFLQNYGITNPNFLWYKILLVLIVISSAAILVRARKQFTISLTVISLTFAVLAYFGIRNLALFGLVSLPLLVYNFSVIRREFFKKIPGEILSFFYILISFILVISILIHFSDRLVWNHDFGFGLSQDSLSSAEFILKNNIHGPIFNNYDIGGAMIFSLFPQEKVFVDNRPEAYPAAFFNNTYIPMQEDPAVFKKVDNQYHFNAIYFYRLDLTPWAQQFLNRMVKDPAWAPVYVDSKTIILLKHDTENAKIISQYELPQSVFITH